MYENEQEVQRLRDLGYVLYQLGIALSIVTFILGVFLGIVLGLGVGILITISI